LNQDVDYCSGAWSKILGTVINSLIQNHWNSNQQPDPKSPDHSPTAWSKIIGIMTKSMIQNNGNNNQQHQAVGYCFHFFISLLVIVPIILNQDVDYCSGEFGSGCWWMLTLFWIKMLATVSIIDQEHDSK
jgi:hypothetical protein